MGGGSTSDMQTKPVMTHTLRKRVERLLDGEYKGDKPLQTLLLLLRGQERHLAIAAILFVIKQSPIWVMPMATRHVLDSVTGTSHGGLREVYSWAGLAAACLAQNIPVHTRYASHVSAAMREAQRDLRSALVIRLQQLSVGFHDSTEAGRLQTKLLRDVDNIGAVLKSSVDVILSAGCTITIAVTIAIIQAPLVAVFFLFAVPLAVGLMATFRGRLKVRNQAFRHDMEDVSVRVNEMIEMLPVTRAHAAENSEASRMRRQLARLTASGRRLDVTTERFAASSWVTFNSFQLLSLLFCAYLVRQHQLTIGQLVMFQSYFTMIVMLVSNTLGVLPQLTAGAESMRSIGEVLESVEVETDDEKRTVETVDGDLRFEHVAYAYPGANRPAIEDFTLHVEPGECVALVGESGSGKSTILNLVIGFRKPTTGRIMLDGIDMAEINFRSFRDHLAIVPQNTVLFSGTVRENITYGLDDISDRRLDEALERANCTEFVGRLPNGVDTVIGSHGGKLSGGQRQRIAIARALLRDPRMLILDEATSALDAHAEHLVQAAINELIVGRTTIIIAHRLATLKSADRIVVLEQGRIIEQGTWLELLNRSGSAFGKAYAMQG